MKAVVATAPGGPDVLGFVDRPAPVAGAGELLVEVVGTAINRADLLQRAGRYAVPPGSTDVLGLELAGRVAAVGADVTGWSTGDRVCALTPGGAHAELVTIPVSAAMRIPDSMTYAQAAAVPETFLTVYDNVLVRGEVAAGRTLLVHGGASGIGTTAIQLARERGASVYVTCGSQRKIDACLELGAAAGIDYHTEDFVERVRELTDGRGVDVVLDHVGAPYLRRNVDCLAMDGRLVMIGTMAGAEGMLDIQAVMHKRVWLTGSRLRPRTEAEKAELVRALDRDIWPALAAGRIAPVVDRVLPWERVAEAHRVLEASDHVGKVVLAVREEEKR
ncbi:MAG: zinc-binding dehydrogenase [Streptosporangiales bacterium]|nr:zinc-binding dehydrogenase [Streptosporangiales bacterium]